FLQEHGGDGAGGDVTQRFERRGHGLLRRVGSLSIAWFIELAVSQVLAQSHFGDQVQSTMRPPLRARPAISFISVSDKSKSRMLKFSSSRPILLVRGITTMPCWVSQRRHT